MVRDTFLRLFVIAAGAVTFAGAASAQLKVGVVDMQQAMLATAEMRKNLADLEAKYKPRQAALEKLRNEIGEIQKKLQAGGLSPVQESQLQLQGQRKQRDYQRMAQDAQEELDAERNEMFSRGGQRLREVVRKLAEERGLDMIFDVNQAIFAKPAMDLTRDAVTAFDKAYPAAAPAAPAPAPAK